MQLFQSAIPDMRVEEHAIPDVHMEGQAYEGHQDMDVDNVPTFAPAPQNNFRWQEEEKVNVMAPQQERPKWMAPDR